MQRDLRASGSRQIVYQGRSHPILGMLLLTIALTALIFTCCNLAFPEFNKSLQLDQASYAPTISGIILGLISFFLGLKLTKSEHLIFSKKTQSITKSSNHLLGRSKTTHPFSSFTSVRADIESRSSDIPIVLSGPHSELILFEAESPEIAQKVVFELNDFLDFNAKNSHKRPDTQAAALPRERAEQVQTVQQAPPQQSSVKTMSRIFWGFCCVVVLCLITGFIASRWSTSEASSTAEDFIAALQSKNFGRAYQLCSPELQRNLESEQFLQQFAQTGTYWEPFIWTSIRSRSNNVFLKSENNISGNVQIHLINIRNKWRIASFQWNPVEGGGLNSNLVRLQKKQPLPQSFPPKPHISKPSITISKPKVQPTKRTPTNTFASRQEFLTHYPGNDFVTIGRFGDSWPATIVEEKTSLNEILFALKSGQKHRYPNFDGYQLKMVRLRTPDDDETIFVLRSTEKQSPQKPSNTSKPDTNDSILVAEGNITFSNQPIHNLTDAKPSFWFRNEDTGKQANPDRVDYSNSHFQIFGLTPARYGMSVSVDANPTNRKSYPGDYRTFKTFDVKDNGTSKLEIRLSKIIRLLQPQDNNTAMKGWDERVDKIAWQSPVTFEWGEIAEDVVYAYSVSLIQSKPWKQLKTLEVGETSETKIEFHLPTNQPEQYYLFSLHAFHNGMQVGMLMTHGNGGYGWDYRFKIKPNDQTEPAQSE